MNKIIKVTALKYLPVIGAVILAMTSLQVRSETPDPMAQRNQALQQQYSRANEILAGHTSATGVSLSSPAASRISSGVPESSSMVRRGNTLVHSKSVSLGIIDLSKDPAINQQLNQGMNDARASLEAIKTLQQGSDEQEHQRSLAAAALDQSVQAYLACRAENKVPINARYERDPFLNQMIVIKQKLMKEKLQDAAVNTMLDRLTIARNKLVEITEKLQ